jgi:hypothetical protein
MAIDSTNFFSLPQEVLQGVLFPHLDYKTLGNCGSVCKRFKKMADADSLWKSLFPNIPFPSTGLKEYLNNHAIASLDKVAEHFQLFADSVQLGTKGKFTILCPLNSDKDDAGGYIEIGAVSHNSGPKDRKFNPS